MAIVGRPNVGKSTLLNAALELPLAIVSPTPQTTRESLLGVVHRGAVEIALLDTPGLHRAETELGRRMNRTARDVALSADVVVFVTDVPTEATIRGRAKPGQELKPNRMLTPHMGDRTLLEDIGKDAPVVLVVNKLDRLRDKRLVLPLLEALGKLRDFAAIVPICGGGSSRPVLSADPARRKALRTLGVWAFHGAKDESVPLAESQRMVDFLKKVGVEDIQLTVYPEAKHDSWTTTYANPELYTWLLRHERQATATR